MCNDQLYTILVCPETHAPLTPADADVIAKLNQAVAAGTLKNRAGHTVREPLDGGLVRQDRAVLYPIVNGIPVMLIDEAIPLEQVG